MQLGRVQVNGVQRAADQDRAAAGARAAVEVHALLAEEAPHEGPVRADDLWLRALGSSPGVGDPQGASRRRQGLALLARRQEPVAAHAVEAARQDVAREARRELGPAAAHLLAVLGPEDHPPRPGRVVADQPVVTEADPRRVARQVAEGLLGVEQRLGVDVLVVALKPREQAGKLARAQLQPPAPPAPGQPREVHQLLREGRPIRRTQHVVGKQAPPRPWLEPASFAQCAGAHDRVHVGVVGEGRVPGVQHLRDREARARVPQLRAPADLDRPTDGPKQRPVDDPRLLRPPLRHGAQPRRQGQDQVVVGHRQRASQLGAQPALSRQQQALRTVPIPAAAKHHLAVVAARADLRRPAQRGRPTARRAEERPPLRLAQPQRSQLAARLCVRQHLPQRGPPPRRTQTRIRLRRRVVAGSGAVSARDRPLPFAPRAEQTELLAQHLAQARGRRHTRRPSRTRGGARLAHRQQRRASRPDPQTRDVKVHRLHCKSSQRHRLPAPPARASNPPLLRVDTPSAPFFYRSTQAPTWAPGGSMPAPLHALGPTSLEREGLRYTLTPDSRRRVVIDVRLSDPAAEGALPHTDRVDLVSHRARLRLAGELADAFGRERRAVYGHLTSLLDAAERAAARAAQAPAPKPLDEERQTRAAALLAREDLLDAAAGCLALVGEERVKRLAYLVATSRLLPRPLSALLLAPSGCGKSSLLDALEQALPAGAVLYLSRLSGQALYYAGADALRHKLVLIDEQVGATEADYSLRTLQSKGFLTVRLPNRGEVRVEGPISLMSGTTSTDLNPENLSRCLELCLDDSPAQTRRIQAAQQRAWARGAAAPGSVAAPGAAAQQTLRDAQRLLEPLAVRIPFAERLRFPARTTHDRRGSEKLLGLVAAHALLHQRQRGRDEAGRLLAEPSDYAAVHALVRGDLARDAVGLSARAARAARALEQAGRLARRELAAALGWSYNTAKRALTELEAVELVARCETGPPARYRLIGRGLLGDEAELLAPAQLD